MSRFIPGRASQSVVPASWDGNGGLGTYSAGISSQHGSLNQWHVMEDILVDVGFDEDNIDTYEHAHRMCPCSTETEIDRAETANTREYIAASREGILATGNLTEEEFEELDIEVQDELDGHSKGVAGPTGGRGVASVWRYWWAFKS
ncbi:hypothetical protein P7C73_g1274, partial [Tremellales sp. Uapishka_1]